MEALREDPSGGLAGFPSDTMVTIIIWNNFPVISYPVPNMNLIIIDLITCCKGATTCINMSYSPSVRSRWLDIGQVLFCMFMDRDRGEVHKLTKKRMRSMSSDLDWKSLVNERFIVCFCGNFSCETRQVVLSGQDTTVATSCPLRQPITACNLVHLACSRS